MKLNGARSVDLPGYFFRCLRDLFIARGAKEDAIFYFVDALNGMPANERMGTLRVRCETATELLEVVLGCNHPIVLGMWTYYVQTKHFASSTLAKFRLQNFRDSYMVTTPRGENECGPMDSQTVDITHHYLNAAIYGCKDPLFAVEISADIWRGARSQLLGNDNRARIQSSLTI